MSYKNSGTSNDGKLFMFVLNILVEFEDDQKEDFMRHVVRSFEQKQIISFLENKTHANNNPDNS